MAKILQDKIALITGASRGIGRAIAEKLAEMGAHIVVNYVRNEEAAREVVTRISARGFLLQLSSGTRNAAVLMCLRQKNSVLESNIASCWSQVGVEMASESISSG